MDFFYASSGWHISVLEKAFNKMGFSFVLLQVEIFQLSKKNLQMGFSYIASSR
jgi:hypothetical protein